MCVDLTDVNLVFLGVWCVYCWVLAEVYAHYEPLLLQDTVISSIHIKALISVALNTSGWSRFCKNAGINCAGVTFIEVKAPITSPGYINIIFWWWCS